MEKRKVRYLNMERGSQKKEKFQRSYVILFVVIFIHSSVIGHAYAILGLAKIRNINLVRLRNPW